MEQIIHDFGVFLSRLLQPLAIGVDVVNRSVDGQLAALTVPEQWRAVVIPLMWAVVTFVVLRALWGWGRLAAMVFLVLMLAKVLGYLPNA